MTFVVLCQNLNSYCLNEKQYTVSLGENDSIIVGEGNGTPLQSSCLENPMDGGAWRAWGPWGREESDTTERLHFHFSLSCIGEGNGNPLQCPCLENPRDGGNWWAAFYGVVQSQTRLKRRSSSSSRILDLIFTLKKYFLGSILN